MFSTGHCPSFHACQLLELASSFPPPCLSTASVQFLIMFLLNLSSLLLPGSWCCFCWPLSPPHPCIIFEEQLRSYWVNPMAQKMQMRSPGPLDWSSTFPPREEAVAQQKSKSDLYIRKSQLHVGLSPAVWSCIKYLTSLNSGSSVRWKCSRLPDPPESFLKFLTNWENKYITVLEIYKCCVNQMDQDEDSNSLARPLPVPVLPPVSTHCFYPFPAFPFELLLPEVFLRLW